MQTSEILQAAQGVKKQTEGLVRNSWQGRSGGRAVRAVPK